MNKFVVLGRTLFEWGNNDKTKEVSAIENSHVSAPDEFKQEVQNEKEIPLPVKSERTSLPNHASLLSIFQNMQIANPKFQMELIDVLEYFAMYHPEISKAVQNIQMANTSHIIKFPESVGENESKKMMEYLMDNRDSWMPYVGGIDGLCDALFTQLAITGCSSYEKIPSNDLKGMRRVYMVSPKNIYFKYNDGENGFVPVQQVPSDSSYVGPKLMQQYVELNLVQYNYIALNIIGESPYGVPPFLAALDSIKIQNNQQDNIAKLVEKLGVLGFLKVLLEEPKISQGESPSAFNARAKNTLNENIDQVKKGLNTGFMIGYNRQEIEMQNVSVNTAGAKELIEMNDIRLISGLKMDPSLMGRNNTTTETFARVILAIMTNQLETYQKRVGSGLCDIYSFALRMNGYGNHALKVEFEPVMMGDKSRAAEAEAKSIENAYVKYDLGLITYQQLAQQLKVDSPAMAESPYPPGTNRQKLGSKEGIEDGNKDDATNPKSTEANKGSYMRLHRGIVEFEYDINYSGMSKMSFNRAEMTEEEIQLWKGYYAAIDRHFVKAINGTVNGVVSGLKKLREGASINEVVNMINLRMFTEWDGRFNRQIQDDIKKWVEETYYHFRLSVRPFAGASAPDAALSLTDARVMDFFVKSDSVYLGKFMTDGDTNKRVTKWITDQYIKNAIPIGSDSVGINLFKKEFGELIHLQNWKIRRILDTTFSHLRNTGAVSYMHQAEVHEFSILSTLSNTTCPYCRALNGKIFKVETAYSKLETLMEGGYQSLPSISPFITSLGLKAADVGKLTGVELENKGIGQPPFHGHCMCTSVVHSYKK